LRRKLLCCGFHCRTSTVHQLPWQTEFYNASSLSCSHPTKAALRSNGSVQGRGKGRKTGRRWLLTWKIVSEEPGLRLLVTMALIDGRKCTHVIKDWLPWFWRKDVIGGERCCTDVLKYREWFHAGRSVLIERRAYCLSLCLSSDLK
jgi:hypothetical protein